MTTQTEKKRLTASERQTFMELVAARTALKYFEPYEKRLVDIPRGRLRYRTARTLLKKVYDDALNTIPTEQRDSIERQLPGLRYSLHVSTVNKGNDTIDGYWLSWKGIETLSEATRDRCLMCQKDIQEQRQCPLAKVLDELPTIQCNENARGCKYFNGLY